MSRTVDLRPHVLIDPHLDFTKDPLGSNYKNDKEDPIFYYSKNKNKELGVSEVDPDYKSKTLQLYQRQLYSKELPDGTIFDLVLDDKPYLKYDSERFSSDSIISSFRYYDYPLIYSISKRPDWDKWVLDFTHKAYTIGGEMLFPINESINVVRGFNNPSVRDRWDLTLYCIQCFYDGKTSLGDKGLNKVLQSVISNKWFYDKFIDFDHYVKFFYLDPCVENGKIVCWLNYLGLPRNEKDYFLYQQRQMLFLEKRTELIRNDCEKRGILKK